MDYVGLIHVHLVYCAAIWYILRPFGIFYGFSIYFSPFDMLYHEKSGNAGSQAKQT
jgi:hypothetical protein